MFRCVTTTTATPSSSANRASGSSTLRTSDIRSGAAPSWGDPTPSCESGRCCDRDRSGEGPEERLDGLTRNDWEWTLGVNLWGVINGISAFLGLLKAQDEGHIVNTASEAGLTPSPLLGAYHATKYAVVGLSESLALELNGTGVGVSCLCPELVDTLVFESTRNAPADLGLGDPPPVDIHQVEQWMQTVAMDPADVAAQVVYAVKAGRFWVLTHQSTLDRVKRRNADLEAGRVPRGVR